MNLLRLAVWCGFLLLCTVSLPRKHHPRKRQAKKYPVTQFQNSYYERSHPTALEILERTLLRPSESQSKYHHPREGSKRSPHEYSVETTPLDALVDNCVASFGDSPICMPRKRQKKSFVGITDRPVHKRLFRSQKEDKATTNHMTLTTSNTIEDFFGLFNSSDPSFITSVDGLISKLDVSSSSTVFNIPSTAEVTRSTEAPVSTTTETTNVSLPISQVAISRQSSFQPSAVVKFKTSSPEYIETATKMESSKIILPGSVQRIESEPQRLYLDSDESPTGDPKAEAYTKAIEETNGVSLAEETEATHLTLPPESHSILTGETYSKEKCESEKGGKCICSLPTVHSDFQTIFSKAKTTEEIMTEIANMKCRHYTPKPAVFDLNTNAKPRVLRGKHKAFPTDHGKGAKEIDEKSFDEYIAYSVLDDGITRVFVSSDVKIPCFPKPDIHLSATDADHVKYTWTFGNKKQTITKGRITEDPDGDGSLAIDDIELTDAMNYTCEIDYIHPDTGERTTDVFVHSLSVVTLPIVSARAMVHYKSTAACDQSLLEMFEMYLPQQVERAICETGGGTLARPKLCNVKIHNSVCHGDGQKETEDEEGEETGEAAEGESSLNRKKRETNSMEMSMNLEVYIHRPAAKELPGAQARLCDPDCHLLVNFKILQILKESAGEIALIPISSKVQGGGTFTPEAGSVKVKYIFGCIGGYHLDNGFCLACPKGTFSTDGATECTDCPFNTYSSSVGTRECTPCGHLWLPVCNEHFESLNIMMILYVLALVVVLLLAFLIYYVFFYKGKTLKEVMKKGPSEKMAKSERIKYRKAKLAKLLEGKKAKHHERESPPPELEYLLNTDVESGAESEPEPVHKIRISKVSK